MVQTRQLFRQYFRIGVSICMKNDRCQLQNVARARRYLAGSFGDSLIRLSTTKPTATTATVPILRSTKSTMLGGLHFRIARIRYGEPRLELISMKTTELLSAACIYARDLLTLNATSRQDLVEPKMNPRAPAAIVPRENLIIVSFGNVRAVVGLNEVHLLDAHLPAVRDFASEIVEVFLERNQCTDSGDSADEARNPHEILFLEGLLRDTIDSFDRRVRILETIVEDILSKVSEEVYSEIGVHQLVPLKETLQSFEIQVKQSVDCLASLLDNDDAMLDLLLSEQKVAQKAGREVDFIRHEQVELLLGVYARQLSLTMMEIQFMLGRIQSKQEFVALALDNYRNRLVRVSVHLAIVGLSLAVGTTAAGFFGMNLVSGLEDSPWAFYSVVSSTSLSALAIAMVSFNYISDSRAKRRAEQRLAKIETLSSALSDVCALDLALKDIIHQGKRLDKNGFRDVIREVRRSKQISDEEVDLLFGVFDKVKDGALGSEDIAFLDLMHHSNAQTRN